LGPGAGGPAPRASHKSDSAALADWTLRVDVWQEWLEPPEGLVQTLRAARAAPSPAETSDGRPDDATNALLLQLRFGFLPSGAPPMTLTDAARTLGIVPQRIAARERLLIAAAMRSEAGRDSPRPSAPHGRGAHRD
jgi:hypothetical protein